MTSLRKKRLARKIRGSYALTWRSALMVVLAGLLVFFVEKMAEKVLPTSTSGWDFFWAAMIVLGLVGLIFFWQHDRIARQISAKADTVRADEITGRPYLICGYSPSFPDHTGSPTGPLALDLSELTTEPKEACRKAGAGLGPWQQNLRVLNALREVRHVYVLRPDTDQTQRFIDILRHFYPKDSLAISMVDDRYGNTAHFQQDAKTRIDPDYEDFRYVTIGIDLAIRKIAKDHGLTEEDAEAKTIIDVTAGFKTFSIAAAIASLNRDLMFVYAGTGKNTGEVLAYDASIEVGRPLEM